MTGPYSRNGSLFSEIHDLAMACLEGRATADQFAQLDNLIYENSEARRLYIQYLSDSICLRYIVSELTLTGTENEAARQPTGINAGLAADSSIRSPVPPCLSFFPNATHGSVGDFSDWLVAYSIATVIFGIGALIAGFTYVSHHVQVAERLPSVTTGKLASESQIEFVGRITGMVDCKWADPTTETIVGAHIPFGRKYSLSSGLMEITYDTGAKVILQGPVTYDVESKNSGLLSIGKLTGKVEVEKAKGFVVRTPTAAVTDLGTEFGVEVDKQGGTTSHVFRGSVRLQTVTGDGKSEPIARVLHKGQSARVNGGGANRITVLVPSAKPVDFVRDLPKRKMKVLDLVDVVAGGDGFSGRRGRGIDPTNGQLSNVVDLTDPKVSALFPIGDGKYHRVEEMPFVDGVFIPDGSAGPVQVDSAGHVFAEFPKTTNQAVMLIWAGGAIPTALASIPTMMNGVDYASQGHGLLFLHPNEGITFDLEAIRRANPGYKLLRFFATAGITGSVEQSGVADLWVFVDGQVQFKRREINIWNGAVPINIAISKNDRFLTLATADGGDGLPCDWTMFGDPRLELSAKVDSTRDAAVER